MANGASRTLSRGRGRSLRGGARPSFLPEGVAAFLHRRLREMIGLGLIVLGGVVLLALVSYDPADPSWNTARAPGPVTNLLGISGAHPADLVIQTVGAAGFILALVPLTWGWRLVRQAPLGRITLRVAALLLVVPVLAAALAPLPPPAAWTGLTSFGGAVGLMLLGALPGGGWSAPLAGAAAVALLVVALGLPLAEWREHGRRLRVVACWLGRIAAAAAAWTARTARTRVAPRLTGCLARLRRGARAADDEDDYDLDIDADEVSAPSASAPSPRQRTAPVVASPAAAQAERAPAVVAAKAGPLAQGHRAAAERQTHFAFDPAAAEYELPPLDLLREPDPAKRPALLNEEALQRNAELLEGVLGDFGVRGEIVRVNPGPVVTLYELEPAPGTKSSRVIGLADDIARSMSAISVRVAVVPGRNAIGIELPNAQREIVYLRELLASKAMEKTGGKLALVLGKDIGGTPVLADLSRMPHLLIAGTTGSGKSVAINTMILSLLYRMPPDRVRLILVDPKMLELSVYDGIPHLLTPVVTDPKKAVVALKWAVREMEGRYRAMAKLGVRNIEGYNQRLREARDKGEPLMRRVQTGFDPDTGKPVFEEEPIDLTELPYIVVVVDEMADLMLVAGKDIEAAIQRLAQMARAAGIHLIMATQRPSVDVITGTIKANFPTRISFQVTSKIDSRTILGEGGAEQLLGQGDMLHMAGGGRIARVHGPFVSDDEVEDVVRFLKTQGEPSYDDSVLEDDDEAGGFAALADDGLGGGGGEAGGSGDDLYDRAVAIVARERKASTSFIQRQLQIGYNRAARLVERMEAEGVVGKPNHVGKREVLVGDHGDD